MNSVFEILQRILRLLQVLTSAPPVSPNKCKILLKTLEQLSIDNLALMNSCIEYVQKKFRALSPI